MMLQETLTNDLISAGERFITKMNEEAAQIPMAVWKRLDDPDGPNVWRLLLAMPVAEAGGQLKCYEKIVSTYNTHLENFFPLSIFDIEVESLDSGVLRPFQEAAKSRRITYLTPDYSSDLADGLFFGDSFIYIPKGKTKLSSEAI